MQRFTDPNSRERSSSKIIDVDPTEAPDLRRAGQDLDSPGSHRRARVQRELERQAREARTRVARDATDVRDSDHARSRPDSFRERHALKVMGAIMSVMFVLVLVAQVGC